jgi:uncharacterized protein (TIGR02271 family)
MAIAFGRAAAIEGARGDGLRRRGRLWERLETMIEGATEDLVPIGEHAHGDADADVRDWRVIAGDGAVLGTVADVLLDRASGEPRFLAIALDASVARTQGGKRVYVPFSAARADRGTRWVHLDGVTGTSAPILPAFPTDDAAIAAPPPPLAHASAETAAALDAAPPPHPEMVDGEARVTLSEEVLEVGTRTVEAGEVRVTKTVETEIVRETVPVMREDVTVERRPLPPGAGLEPRVEGDEIHVPIVEEEIVVTKRLVAREELVIRKRQVVRDEVVEAEVRRERAEVLGPDDMVDPIG